MTPIITVIVPVYRDRSGIEACLVALDKQSLPKSSFEIIVINNDPTDGAMKNLQLPTNARMLDEEKKGSYAARNLGIAAARGKFFAFTDADCLPSNRWLEEGLNALLSGASRVAGRIDLTFKSGKPNWVESYEKEFSFRQHEYARNGFAATANMFAERILFETIGLFDAETQSGGDTDWGRRATAAGVPIEFCEKAIVLHPARNTLSDLLKKRKRVILGLNFLSYEEGRAGVARCFRSLLPPIRLGASLLWRKSLRPSEKFVTFMMAYLVKVYDGYLFFRLLMARNDKS